VNYKSLKRYDIIFSHVGARAKHTEEQSVIGPCLVVVLKCVSSQV